jgi:hypothetical protein
MQKTLVYKKYSGIEADRICTSICVPRKARAGRQTNQAGDPYSGRQGALVRSVE